MIASRNRETLERTAQEIGQASRSSVLAVPTDLCQPEDITALVTKTVNAFGGIDILVNNTGGPPAGTNALRPAVVGLAKTLSVELAPSRITVNNVCPGRMRTDRLRQGAGVQARIAQGLTEEQALSELAQDIPWEELVFQFPLCFPLLLPFCFSCVSSLLANSLKIFL